MNKGIVWIVIILIVILGLWFFVLKDGDENANLDESVGDVSSTTPEPGVGDSDSGSSGARVHSISITSNGYNPNFLEINAGEIVKWTNIDQRPNWPATDVHPTHTLYPGSNRNKCGSSAESEIFDACKGLAQGESYRFTFNNRGSWDYHDHLRASMKGTIVVN